MTLKFSNYTTKTTLKLKVFATREKQDFIIRIKLPFELDILYTTTGYKQQ